MNKLLRRLGMVLTLLMVFPSMNGQAGQEFRGFNPIPTPALENKKTENLLAEGYQAVTPTQVLPVDLVEKVVHGLFNSWNTPELGTKLSKELPNKSRILDAIQTGAPRYVKLQVLSIQNPRIVKQYVRPHPSGDGSWQVMSKISVRVTSQAAASTNVSKRFQRVDGTSEYIISVTQKVKPA